MPKKKVKNKLTELSVLRKLKLLGISQSLNQSPANIKCATCCQRYSFKSLIHSFFPRWSSWRAWEKCVPARRFSIEFSILLRWCGEGGTSSHMFGNFEAATWAAWEECFYQLNPGNWATYTLRIALKSIPLRFSSSVWFRFAVFRIAKLPHLGQTTCLGYGLWSTVFGLQSAVWILPLRAKTGQRYAFHVQQVEIITSSLRWDRHHAFATEMQWKYWTS